MKTEIEDKLSVEDNHGFIYMVTVKHWPNVGLSIAYYNGDRIASREYGRMTVPVSDSDKEWEEYEERFREWADAAINDLILDCKEYFKKFHEQWKGK